MWFFWWLFFNKSSYWLSFCFLSELMISIRSEWYTHPFCIMSRRKWIEHWIKHHPSLPYHSCKRIQVHMSICSHLHFTHFEPSKCSIIEGILHACWYLDISTCINRQYETGTSFCRSNNCLYIFPSKISRTHCMRTMMECRRSFLEHM